MKGWNPGLLLYVPMGLIIVVCGVEYWLIDRFVAEQHKMAEVTHISVQQRVLAQKGALWAERLTSAMTEEQRNTARTMLRETAQDLSALHGNLLSEEAEDLPETNLLYYNGPLWLDKQVRTYIRQLEMLSRIADAQSGKADAYARHIAIESSRPLLLGLDAVAEAYKNRMERKRQVLRFASMVVLLSPVLLYLFILSAMSANRRKTAVIPSPVAVFVR